MISYQSEIVINRPLAEVFDYATTFENLPKWSDTHSVRRLSTGPVGVGALVQIDMGKGPVRSQIEFKTIRWEKDRSWAFKTVSASPIVWDGSFEFESLGPDSTRMRMGGQVTLKGWRRLLEPLVRGELRKGEQAELEKLKGLLEDHSMR